MSVNNLSPVTSVQIFFNCKANKNDSIIARHCEALKDSHIKLAIASVYANDYIRDVLSETMRRIAELYSDLEEVRRDSADFLKD